MTIPNNVVNAAPTKEFFIHMITRDIGLIESINELVDNCIDGAKRIRKNDNLIGLYVDIKISKDKFVIEDNCGGISLDVAKEYAFRFGRPTEYNEKVDYSIGRFGIGMKRSIFKIGNIFTIESKTNSTFFKINVDVNKWKKEKEWFFNFDEMKEDGAFDNTGTIITIEELNENTSRKFESDIFISELKQHIEKYNSEAIRKGLIIKINDYELSKYKNELYEDEDIKPAYKELNINGVDVKIIAGITKKGKPHEAGWYLYCNERLVVSADRTKLSGWGEDGITQYHVRYAGFRGYVFFESKDAKKLPWNTTKTGVDEETEVFVKTKSIMKNILKEVLGVIKSLENEEINDAEIDNEVFNEVRMMDIKKIKTEDLEEKIQVKRLIIKNNNMATITYKKQKKEVEKLKEILKVSSNADVGKKTFEYFVEMECED